MLEHPEYIVMAALHRQKVFPTPTCIVLIVVLSLLFWVELLLWGVSKYPVELHGVEWQTVSYVCFICLCLSVTQLMPEEQTPACSPRLTLGAGLTQTWWKMTCVVSVHTKHSSCQSFNTWGKSPSGSNTVITLMYWEPDLLMTGCRWCMVLVCVWTAVRATPFLVKAHCAAGQCSYCS